MWWRKAIQVERTIRWAGVGSLFPQTESAYAMSKWALEVDVWLAGRGQIARDREGIAYLSGDGADLILELAC